MCCPQKCDCQETFSRICEYHRNLTEQYQRMYQESLRRLNEVERERAYLRSMGEQPRNPFSTYERFGEAVDPRATILTGYHHRFPHSTDY